MKLIPLVTALALATLTAPAAADTRSPASAPGLLQVPVIVVYGRPERPNVVIVFKTPNATSEAGEAHESLRAGLMAHWASDPLRVSH